MHCLLLQLCPSEHHVSDATTHTHSHFRRAPSHTPASARVCPQSALAKERRELQQQQQRTLLEAIPKDLSRPWEDPMPEEGERHLAAVSCGGFVLLLLRSHVPGWRMLV
jgi:hypothetical protein